MNNNIDTNGSDQKSSANASTAVTAKPNHSGPVGHYELGWIFALVGTGLGAGVLYLPFAIGTGGFLPLVVLALLCGPLVFHSHRNLSRACMSEELSGSDMHSLVQYLFPPRFAFIFTIICLIAVFPTVLVYSIGITNLSSSFITHQLKLTGVDYSVVAIAIITLLVAVIVGGEKWLLSVSSAMVAPLTVIMFCLGIYLIPYWNHDLLTYVPNASDFFKVMLLGLPVMVFSFYHAPMCAVMVKGYKKRRGTVEQKVRSIEAIHRVAFILLFVVILFFVSSCLLCLSREELLAASRENLPILSVLANASGTPWFFFMAPLIAFLAIGSSFFGFFLGTVEIFNGVFIRLVNSIRGANIATATSVHRISILVTTLGCYIAAISNWNILETIASLVAPAMAVVVFFIPLYAKYRIPSQKQFRSIAFDTYVLLGGAFVVSGFLLSLFR